MADTSLAITSTTPQDKKITTTITYVNPNMNNSDLKTFAQKLNALTNNTYEGATRIEKNDVDTAPIKAERTPTFKLSTIDGTPAASTSTTITTNVSNVNWSANSKQIVLTITEITTANDTARVRYSNLSSTTSSLGTGSYFSDTYGGTGGNFIIKLNELVPQTITFDIDAVESNNYLPYSQTITINITPDE